MASLKIIVSISDRASNKFTGLAKKLGNLDKRMNNLNRQHKKALTDKYNPTPMRNRLKGVNTLHRSLRYTDMMKKRAFTDNYKPSNMLKRINHVRQYRNGISQAQRIARSGIRLPISANMNALNGLENRMRNLRVFRNPQNFRVPISADTTRFRNQLNNLPRTARMRIRVPVHLDGNNLRNIERNMSRLRVTNRIRLRASDEVSPVMQRISGMLARVRRVPTIAIRARDGATNVINRVISNAGRIRTSYTTRLNAIDRFTGPLSRAGGMVRNFAGRTFTSTIRVVDMATRPLQSIARAAFSTLGLLGVTGGAVGGIMIPLKAVADRQDVTTQFEVMLGGAQEAANRVDELTTFAGSTPFLRDDIFEASRVLQTFTGDALSTGEGLKLIGDVAAGTKRPINEVAMWFGRLYDGLQSGRPVGDATMALQEMGAMSGETRNMIEELAESGGNIADIWPQVTAEFSTYDDMMEKMSGNLNNLLLGMRSFFTNTIMMPWGAGLESALGPALMAFREWRGDNADVMQGISNDLERYASSFGDIITKPFYGLGSIFDEAFQNEDLNGLGEQLQYAMSRAIEETNSWLQSTGIDKISGFMGGLGESYGGGLNKIINGLMGTGDDDDSIFSTLGELGRESAVAFGQGFIEELDPGDLIRKAFGKIGEINVSGGKSLLGHLIGDDELKEQGNIWGTLLVDAMLLAMAAKFLPGFKGILAGLGTLGGGLMTGLFGKSKDKGGKGFFKGGLVGALFGGIKKIDFKKLFSGLSNIKLPKGLGKLLTGFKGIPLVGTLTSAFGLITGDAEKMGESIGTILGGLGGAGLGSIFGPVGTAIGGILGSMGGAKIGDLWDTGVIQEKWAGFSSWFSSNVWEPVKNGATTAWDWISETAVNTWNSITESLSAIWSGIVDIATPIFQGVATFFSTIWEYISTVTLAVWNVLSVSLTEIWGYIVDIAEPIFGWLSEFFSGLWEGISSAAITAWDFITEHLSNAWNWISEIAKSVFGNISEFLTNVWNGISEAAMAAWEFIAPYLSTAWNGISDTAITVFGYISEFLTGIWSGISNAAVVAWDFIKGHLTTAWNYIVELATPIFNGLSEYFSLVWNTIKDATSIVWETISNMLSTAWGGIQELADGNFSSISEIIDIVWTTIKDTTSIVWEGIKSYFGTVLSAIGEFFTTRFENMRVTVTTIFENISSFFSSIWSTIQNTFNTVISSIVTFVQNKWNDIWSATSKIFNDVYSFLSDLWSNTWSTVTGFANDIWTGVTDAWDGLWTNTKDIFNDIEDWVSDTFDNLVDGAKELPGRIGDAIKNAASFAVDGVKSMGNSIMSTLDSVLNGGIISGLNSVLEALNVSAIDEINIPTFSTGTSNGRISRDTPGILNDRGPGNGRGGATQELIERRGKLLMPRGKNALVGLKRGDKIYNGAQTQSIFESNPFPHFSEGTIPGEDAGSGAEKKGLLGTLADVVSNVWDYVTSPKKAFNAIIDSVSPDFSGFGGFPGKMLSGVWNTIKEGGLKFLTGIFKDNEGGNVDGSSILGKSILQPFGRYIGGIMFNGGRHYGIDTNHKFDPVLSPASGKVTRVWNDYGGGNSLELTNARHIWWFMHLSKILKSVGDSVKTGEHIATSGNSGNFVVGSGHLHTQLHNRSTGAGNHNAIDPMPVLKGHATGGYVTSRTLSYIGENGKEFVIPVERNKAQGRMYLSRAANMLGMRVTPASENMNKADQRVGKIIDFNQYYDQKNPQNNNHDKVIMPQSKPQPTSSGGSKTVHINFNGDIHVRNDEDIEKIAERVKRSIISEIDEEYPDGEVM